MNSRIIKFAAGAPKEVAPRTFRFVASTGERDRDHDMIDPAGWQLDNYLRNPVVLLGHDASSAPVARASRVAVDGGRLMVDVQFPSEGASEASDEAYALVSEGFMRAVSVGFRPLEWQPMPDGRGMRFTAVELLEVSLVSVPANANALLAARSGGKGEASRPIYVDGKPLTPARLVAILAERGARAAASRPATREEIAAAVRNAVREAVGREIRKHTGALD